ncbi:MarR family transcriptional regulator [Micromonospora sp. NPDC050686]|uniref:MarR family transcriptional regulator n=1 Tax=Micromonospora sp. NPDC050686 TaxID=3154631 RepID=UPI0033C77AC5
MDQLSLTPATQAVLNALTELGQGTAHELADTSGKARSTTDKAIKTLADARVIVAVDLESDDDGPTRWVLAATADTAPDDTAAGDGGEAEGHDTTLDDPDNATDAPGARRTGQLGGVDDNHTDADDTTGRGAHASDGVDETTDRHAIADRDGHTREDGESQTVTVAPARPGDRKVMAIKGVLADHGDAGVPLDVIVAESGIRPQVASRLLTAMEQADAARRLPGLPQRWVPGPTRASEVDPDPAPSRCPLCHHTSRGLPATPDAAAQVLALTRPDGTLHIVDPDGHTHVVTLPTRTTPPIGSGDGTGNADGSRPFARGELERLTLDVLAANIGKQMTPQDIATMIGEQLGRTVSPGAVRNNCTKAAAAGRIRLVSDAPLTFAYPTADTGAVTEADTATTQGGEVSTEQP